MRDEGVSYVAGHPLLNRRCTRLTGCIRLRNDVHIVGWGHIVKLNSHSLTFGATSLCGNVGPKVLPKVAQIRVHNNLRTRH